MREMEKIKNGSMQIAFLPLGEQRPEQAVNRVLAIIKDANVTADVGPVSTLLRGKPDSLFSLLNEIYETMDSEGFQFSMSVLISNTCGCSK
jgi:uncharacterized protein YqgV (UPF0045/DUF77 family)